MRARSDGTRTVPPQAPSARRWSATFLAASMLGACAQAPAPPPPGGVLHLLSEQPARVEVAVSPEDRELVARLTGGEVCWSAPERIPPSAWMRDARPASPQDGAPAVSWWAPLAYPQAGPPTSVPLGELAHVGERERAARRRATTLDRAVIHRQMLSILREEGAGPPPPLTVTYPVDPKAVAQDVPSLDPRDGTPRPEEVALGRRAIRALTLNTPSAVSYAVPPGPPGRLHLEWAIRSRRAALVEGRVRSLAVEAGGVRLRILLEEDGANPRELASQPAGETDTLQPLEVALPATSAGARIAFRFECEGDSAFAPLVVLGEPRVDRPPAGDVRPPSVVLLLVDTLRADHLGCYGHTRAQSTAIDRLAAEGVRYARCWSAAPWSFPPTRRCSRPPTSASTASSSTSDLPGPRRPWRRSSAIRGTAPRRSRRVVTSARVTAWGRASRSSWRDRATSKT